MCLWWDGQKRRVSQTSLHIGLRWYTLPIRCATVKTSQNKDRCTTARRIPAIDSRLSVKLRHGHSFHERSRYSLYSFYLLYSTIPHFPVRLYAPFHKYHKSIFYGARNCQRCWLFAGVCDLFWNLSSFTCHRSLHVCIDTVKMRD